MKYAKIFQKIDDTSLLINILFRSEPNLSNQIIPTAGRQAKTGRMLARTIPMIFDGLFSQSPSKKNLSPSLGIKLDAIVLISLDRNMFLFAFVRTRQKQFILRLIFQFTSLIEKLNIYNYFCKVKCIVIYLKFG